MYDISLLQLPSLTPLPSLVLLISPSCFYCCLLYLNSFRGGRPNQKAHFLMWVGTDEFTQWQLSSSFDPWDWCLYSVVAAKCCLCLCLPLWGEIKGWMYVWSVWGVCSINDSIIDPQFELPITKSLTSREWDESLSQWSLSSSMIKNWVHAPWFNLLALRNYWC